MRFVAKGIRKQAEQYPYEPEWVVPTQGVCQIG
jgi:hypothetical protein